MVCTLALRVSAVSCIMRAGGDTNVESLRRDAGTPASCACVTRALRDVRVELHSGTLQSIDLDCGDGKIVKCRYDFGSVAV